jgi:uncharacterized protein (DUF433 family)
MATSVADRSVDKSGDDPELIPADSPLAGLISVRRGRMHDEPCFAWTRVPVQCLFDHIRSGESLAEFLDGFPDVSRDQCVAVIDLSANGLLTGLPSL